MRVAARLETQHRSRVPGDLVVVDEELFGGLGIQVDEPRCIRRPARIGKHGGIERSGELIHREYIVTAVADPGGRVGDGIEHLLQGRSNSALRFSGTSARARAGLASERKEVIAFSLIELQRGGESIKNALRGAGQTASLHADVVVHRDSGEHRDLLTPQALDPAVAAVRRQPRLRRTDARTPGAQELPDFAPQIHRGHAPTVGAPRAA